MSVATTKVAAAPLAGADASKLLMLCETRATVAEAMAGHPSVLEPKLDGWRALFSVVSAGTDPETGEPVNKCVVSTRQGKDLTGKMPAIEAALAAKLKPGSTLDGEAVAFSVDSDGRLIHRWGRVQEVLGSGKAKAALMSGDLTLVVFDVLALAGIDARTVTFGKRRELLEKQFAAADFPPSVMLVPQVEATDASHEAILANGYEGSVVKWLDAPYRSAVRGKGWFRLKPQTTIDVIVTGYKDGTPGSSFDGYVGAVEFGQYDPGTGLLVHRGRCSGMDWPVRQEISANRAAHLGRVMEVAHMGTFPPSPDYPAGSLRHPQYKRFRTDVEPLSVEVSDG